MSVDITLLKSSLELQDIEVDEDRLDKYIKTIKEYRKNNRRIFDDTNIVLNINKEKALYARAIDQSWKTSDKDGKIAINYIKHSFHNISVRGDTELGPYMVTDLKPAAVATGILNEEDLKEIQTLISNALSVTVSSGYTRDKVFKQSLPNKLCGKEDIKNAVKDFVLKTLKHFSGIHRMSISKDMCIELGSFLEKVFGQDKVTITQSKKQPSCKPEGIISTVIEVNNVRFAKIRCSLTSTYGARHLGCVATPSSKYYNYLDAGRQVLVYHTHDRAYYIKSARRSKICQAIIHEMDVNLPEEELLINLMEEEYNHLASPDIVAIADLKSAAQRLQMELDQKAKNTKKQSTLKDKISQKIKILKTKNKGALKFNDVNYSHHEINYEGQVLKRIDGKKDWVYHLLEQSLRSYKIEEITFDVILSNFIASLDVSYKKDPVSAVIGDVEVERSWKRIDHANGNQQILHYINKKRINKDEVSSCLERALCYTETDEYKAFISEVSKCSLRFHRFLHNGLDFRVRDPFVSNQYKIRIPLERRSNINYLDINGELYRVSNTNKILNNLGVIRFSKFSDLLTESGAVNGVVIKDIVPILKEGKQTYEDAIEKSKKLVESTEKLFNLSANSHSLEDGANVVGYRIKGKLREYIIQYDPNKDVNDQSHGVYEYPTGRYICIVDKSTDQAGYDKLINRIYALHNDNLVASKISTL